MRIARALLARAGSFVALLLGVGWVSTLSAQTSEESAPATAPATTGEAGRPAATLAPATTELQTTGDQGAPSAAAEQPAATLESAPEKKTAPPAKAPNTEAKDEPSTKKEETKAPAKKPQPPPPPRIDYAKLPFTYHQKRFDFGAGLLVGWVQDPAFDLFQTKNAYAAWEARGAVGLWASGALSLAVTANFNHTTVEGEVRTLPSFLRASRVHGGAEARYHFVPRLYAYGRIDLGAFFAESRLGEADAPTRMRLRDGGFSGGAHLGGAVRVAGCPDGRLRAPRLHLFAEGGLEYDSSIDLTYEMAEEGALRPAPVELGTLSLGGPRVALGALVSY